MERGTPYDQGPYRERDRAREYEELYRQERGTPTGPVDPYAAHPGYPPIPQAGPSRAPYDRHGYEYSYEQPSTSWSSSRHPTQYAPRQYSYPGYTYPQGPGPHSGPPMAPPDPSRGYGSAYSAPGHPVAPGHHSLSSRHPSSSTRPPTPPPPASPSQLQRAPPPPPASAPSPPKEGSLSPGSYLPGFQPDYDRSREARRPASTEPTASGGAVAVAGGEVRPPPTEAYLLLRPHRTPRGGWEPGTEVSSPVSETAGWSFELNVLQHPEKGKALGVENLRRGWPPLTPPLIVQMIVRDQHGDVVATDNATLARRLVHITMNVELVAPDSFESRSLMRVRPPSRASLPRMVSSPPRGRTHATARGNVQPYYPASAPPPYSIQKTLLGSCVRTAQVLTRDGRKGLYFIFQDMIVRPEGRYALEGKVLDLAGPPHIGTSIGVTHPLAHCRTKSFEVFVPQDFTAPVPITPLSQEFLRQGERHLGVSAAQLAAIAKQKRRPRNEDGDSDQEDAGTGD